MPAPLMTRQEAILLGEKHYFTGKPCPHGHISVRRVHNRCCLECDKQKTTASARRWYLRNKEIQHERNKSWLKENPEVRRSIEQRYYRNSVTGRLGKLLRSRLWAVLNGRNKLGSAVSDLGCTVLELKSYLETMFQPGMTWENHGDIWEIDHHRPLMSFDLSIRKQLLEACHYSNLRPMFRQDHYQKTQNDIHSYRSK